MIARCSNPSEVADAVGETFLAALGAAARFRDDGGDAGPWLYGIARRVLARQRRSLARRQRLIRRLESLPSFGPAEAEAVDAAIDAARLGPGLVAALAKLRPRDQELLRLVAHEGLSPAQAGEALGLNPNTARIRLFRPGPGEGPARRYRRRSAGGEQRRNPMFSRETNPGVAGNPGLSQAMERR